MKPYFLRYFCCEWLYEKINQSFLTQSGSLIFFSKLLLMLIFCWYWVFLMNLYWVNFWSEILIHRNIDWEFGHMIPLRFSKLKIANYWPQKAEKEHTFRIIKRPRTKYRFEKNTVYFKLFQVINSMESRQRFLRS